MTTRKNRDQSRSAAETLFNKAIALQKAGDLTGAIKKYRALLKDVPNQPQVLNMYAAAASELGDFRKAADLLEKATQTSPDYADAWLNLGVVRQKAGERVAASRAYDRFRELAPGNPAGHLNFGNVCQLLNRFDDAVSAYEQALALTQSDPVIWSNYARACLYAGDWSKTLSAADKALAMMPGNTGALAIKSAALLELGKAGEVAKLVDFDKLIEIRDFSAPDGYADMRAFNDALCAHCLDHPSLVFEPSENTTMMGHQSGNLSQDRDQGPIAPLLSMISDAVRDYQKSHPATQSHPFLAQRPDRWTYNIWATILGSQGHQAPHIHRAGWLSGCYYAKIPAAIASGSDDRAGWIEFGQPQDHPKSSATAEVRAYKPHEGMVVLFPSYFYHRTIPFESEEKRISIAFDIIPAR